MITDEELDRVIEQQHKFHPECTLEEIASRYAQRAARHRRAKKHGSAEWCDKIVAALYQRIRAGQLSETDPTP
jgi:hypothetical protein